MASMSGFITYIKYAAGTTKGETTQGTELNTPFKLGNVDANYTSSRVVETFDATGSSTACELAWAAAVVEDGKLAGGKVTVDGVETTAYTVATADGVTTVTVTATSGAKIRIAYVYDNEVVPQNDIPTITATMENISLFAKARRIAVYYSQLAQFQAKTDYGVDLADQLSEKAVGQVAYEIDTEVTDLLIENAPEEAELVWSKELPHGVSKQEHYAGFAEILEIGRQKIYDATKRFSPNWMLIASNVLPVLTFMPGFQAAPAGQINGPYFAGTVNGLKVFVTPNIAPGKFVLGCLGNDMMSAAAVYAPYMPIVPTQLLQYADGLTAQGFSTLYDLKMLNTSLLVAGKITA